MPYYQSSVLPLTLPTTDLFSTIFTVLFTGRSVYSSHQDVSKTFGQAHMPAHSLISPERTLWGPHAGSLPKTNVVKRGSVVSTTKCKCDCKLDDGVCGRAQDGQLEYFPSKCAMECYACTHGKSKLQKCQ